MRSHLTYVVLVLALVITGRGPAHARTTSTTEAYSIARLPASSSASKRVESPAPGARNLVKQRLLVGTPPHVFVLAAPERRLVATPFADLTGGHGASLAPHRRARAPPHH